jgi:hypothetical protein
MSNSLRGERTCNDNPPEAGVKPARALRFLARALEDEDACGCSAMALRWYGTPEAEAFLRDAANSSLPHTRRCAEEEL